MIGNTISAGGITSNLGLAYSGTTNVLVDGNNFTGDPGIAIDIIGNGAGTIQNNTIRGSNYGIKMQ